MPAPRTMVDAIFFSGRKLDCQSIGSGIDMRYKSVEALAVKDVQTIGLEIAA